MPPFAQAQPFELAREIEVLTREPSEVQPPHWGWRTVGGHRDIKTGEVSGMVPSPHYWRATSLHPEPEREPTFNEVLAATLEADYAAEIERSRTVTVDEATALLYDAQIAHLRSLGIDL